MRAFKKGESFIQVPAEVLIPTEEMLDELELVFNMAAEGGRSVPVFSEINLYPRLGKSDARFVLAIAQEYEHVIAVLGAEKVRTILDQKKPK